MARRPQAKKSTLSVNFKGVEAGRSTLPEGEYHVKVAEVTQEEGQNAPYLKWKLEVTEGKFEGKFAFTNTSLAPQALWNLRGLLEALGVEVPDDDLDIDLGELVDLGCRITIEHEKYEGKTQARVVDYGAVDAEAEEPEEAPARGKQSSRDKDVEEAPARGRRSSREEPEAEADEPAPRSRRAEKRAEKKAEKKKLPKLTEDDVSDFSQDELEDTVKDYKLDVELEGVKTLSKMRRLVIEALEEGEFLEAA